MKVKMQDYLKFKSLKYMLLNKDRTINTSILFFTAVKFLT